MKLSILTEKLQKGISFISKISSKKVSLPILENILISTEKNFLKLSVTNLETGIYWYSLAKIEKEGKICVQKEFFEDLIFLLPPGKIELEEKKLILEVKTKNFSSKIKGQDPEEFPIIPQPKEEEFVLVNSKDFCKYIKKVLNLPATSLARPEISGILLEFTPNEIKIVATDSFRLAEERIPKKTGISKDFSLILPQISAREIYNIFSQEEREIKIYPSVNQFFLESQMIELKKPEIQYTCRLIEGEYPNYTDIIPKKFGTEVVLNKEEFLQKIKTASLFSSKINEIKLKFLPKENKIEIFSENPNLGEVRTEISRKVKGKELRISFNYKFLIDGLLSIDENEFIFSLTDSEGPAMIKPLEKQNYFYLLMPIKMS